MSASRQLEERFREAAAESGRGDAGGAHLVDAVREHDAHAHVEVPLDMAMEGPGAGVVELEPNGRPSEGEKRHVVAGRGVVEVECKGRLDGIVNPIAEAHDPEIVPVEVPGMNLRRVGLERGGVLENELDDVAGGELVHAAGHGSVGIGRRREDVVPGGWVGGRRGEVHGAGDVVHERGQERRLERRVGHIVNGPFHLPVPLVLRVEQHESSRHGVLRRVERVRRRVRVVLQGFVHPRLCFARRRVVPRRPLRPRRRGMHHRRIVVVQNAQPRRRERVGAPAHVQRQMVIL